MIPKYDRRCRRFSVLSTNKMYWETTAPRNTSSQAASHLPQKACFVMFFFLHLLPVPVKDMNLATSVLFVVCVSTHESHLPLATTQSYASSLESSGTQWMLFGPTDWLPGRGVECNTGVDTFEPWLVFLHYMVCLGYSHTHRVHAHVHTVHCFNTIAVVIL